MRRPNFLIRISMTEGRPIRMGWASFSSMTVCTARSTRSFAIGVDDALGRLLGLGEQRAHQLARVVHEAHQLLAVGLDVLDGTGGHAGLGGGLGHGRGDLHDQARIEGLGDDVVGAERQFLAGVGAGHFVVLLGLGQVGDGLHASQLHFFRDARGAGVHGAAEDEGKHSTLLTWFG